MNTKLTKNQNTELRRVSALVAHTHPTFQKKRTPAERAEIVKAAKAAYKAAPAWLKARVTAPKGL